MFGQSISGNVDMDGNGYPGLTKLNRFWWTWLIFKMNSQQHIKPEQIPEKNTLVLSDTEVDISD